MARQGDHPSQWGRRAQAAVSAMPMAHYEYAPSEGTLDEYYHDHPRMPPAGVCSAKLRQHTWKKITLGNQFDNQEPSFFVDLDGPSLNDDFFGQPFQSTGRGNNRHGDKHFAHARVCPTNTSVAAGVTSKKAAKEELARGEARRPGDAWENVIGRAPRQIAGGRSGNGLSVPIDCMQKKAKGLCNRYADPVDIIAHTDNCDHRYNMKIVENGRKKPVENHITKQRPWSFEPHDPREPAPPLEDTKIPGLPNRVFVSVDGKKQLNICGAEDLIKMSRECLTQDLAPSRHHVKKNDKTELGFCHFQPLWDQIDGREPVRKPSWNESKKVWGLMDRKGMDEQPVKPVRSKSAKAFTRLKSTARSRSMEAAGRRHSDMSKWDRDDVKRAANPACHKHTLDRPWAEYAESVASVAPSDSISQWSMPQARPQESTMRSYQGNLLAYQGPSDRGSQLNLDMTQRTDNRSEIAPSDSISQVSRPSQVMRRSRSARGDVSQSGSQSGAQRSRADPGPSDVISQRSVPRARSQENVVRRSQSARDTGIQTARLRPSPSQNASITPRSERRDSGASGRSAQASRRSRQT